MRTLLILSAATTMFALAAPVMAQNPAPPTAAPQASGMCGCCKNMASMSQPGTMPGMQAPAQGDSTPAQPR